MVRTMNEGKEFEFEVLRLLQAMGFEAEVTGYSQDGGVDLVATNSGPLPPASAWSNASLGFGLSESQCYATSLAQCTHKERTRAS